MKQKLEYLNGLRGLAALVVVFHHFAYVFLVWATRGAGAHHYAAEGVIYATPLQLLVAGNFAVCIFFILSGFVLSYAFFQTGAVAQVQGAALKRYFRLMPPILMSVLLSWAILTLGLHWNHEAAAITGAPWLNNFWPRAVSLGEALRYGAWDILVGNGQAGLLNNALWTMKIEFFGSMLVFGFLGLFGKLRLRWIAYAVLVLITWKTYYLAFVLGIALCDVSARKWSPGQLAWPVVAGLVAGGLWLGAAPIPGPTHTLYDAVAWPGADRQVVFVLTHIVGAAMVLGALLYSPVLKMVFASRPLRYLGRVSFSMYLLHVLVLGSFVSYLFTVMSIGHGYLTSMVVAGIGYLVMVVILSDIFTRYVDEPSIRLASAVGRRLMRARKPAAAPPEPVKKPDIIGPTARVNATNS